MQGESQKPQPDSQQQDSTNGGEEEEEEMKERTGASASNYESE